MYRPDVHQGLIEMKRVLSPKETLRHRFYYPREGTLLFNACATDSREAWAPPPPPGQPGPFSLGSPGGLASRFEEAGFGRLRRTRDGRTSALSLRRPSACGGGREASGTMGQMVSHLGREEQDAIWSEVTDALSEFESSDGFEHRASF